MDVKNGLLTNEVWENSYQEGVVIFNTTLKGIEAQQAHKPWKRPCPCSSWHARVRIEEKEGR